MKSPADRTSIEVNHASEQQVKQRWIDSIGWGF